MSHGRRRRVGCVTRLIGCNAAITQGQQVHRAAGNRADRSGEGRELYGQAGTGRALSVTEPPAQGVVAQCREGDGLLAESLNIEAAGGGWPVAIARIALPDRQSVTGTCREGVHRTAETEQMPGFWLLKVTGRPEVAVADTANPVPAWASAGCVKLMLWEEPDAA